MDQNKLKTMAGAYGVSLDEIMLDRFEKYALLLQEWNAKMNLTAIDDEEGILEKHFLDCLIPLSHVKLEGSLADVGSGAGFPGLVFAIARPDVKITLIEPTGKRCTFLKEVVTTLGLENVTVENERAEDYVKAHREQFDTVTARAVANLPVLSELCVPLIKKGGQFLAMKGARGAEEAQMAEHAYQVLGLSRAKLLEAELPCKQKRVDVLAVKEKSTPMQYPRPYARIKKKPL